MATRTVDLGSVIGPQGPAGPNEITSATETDLTGVLMGDGSNVDVRSVDAVPTPSSTNLVTSGGVYSVMSNRNLLDNWYFVGGGSQQGGGQFPINQRGYASYAWNGVLYSIDRWKWDTLAAAPLEVQSDGINLNASALTVGNPYIRQIVDNVADYRGKQMTLSALVTSVSGASNVGYLRVYDGSGSAWGVYIATDAGLWSTTFTVPSNASAFLCDIGVYTGKSAKVVAAKLELGSISTLANDTPPDYGVELSRCIYSTVDPSDTYANTGFGFARSNRNLLDNAYFVGGGSQQGGGQFPINQRGQTSYQTNGYTIDRWALGNAFICTPESNGLRLNPNNQNNRQFIQSVENAQQYAGKTLTLSVMIPENTASLLFFQVFGTVIDPGAGFTGLYSTTITAPNTISDTSVKIRFNARYADTGNALISAIKLELGPIQTLAHQENGVWVLNDIPNYAEELAKCQRYFHRIAASPTGTNVGVAVSTTSTNYVSMAIPITPCMRYVASPTVTIYGDFVAADGSGVGTAQNATYSSKLNLSGDILTLGITASRFATKGAFIVWHNANSYIDISCDL